MLRYYFIGFLALCSGFWAFIYGESSREIVGSMVFMLCLGLAVVVFYNQYRIESKLDEQVSQMQRLLDVLSSDNSPNLPSAEDVRGIFKRKDGD